MYLFEDMLRLSPAPTVKREAAVFALTIVILLVLSIVARGSTNSTLIFTLLGALGIYAIGRMAYRCVRPEGTS